MKKLVLVLTLVTTMFSCDSRYLTTQSIKTGQILTVIDNNNATKVGDTLVIMKTFRANSLFGKYVGYVPNNFVRNGTNIKYDVVIRIK